MTIEAQARADRFREWAKAAHLSYTAIVFALNESAGGPAVSYGAVAKWAERGVVPESFLTRQLIRRVYPRCPLVKEFKA